MNSELNGDFSLNSNNSKLKDLIEPPPLIIRHEKSKLINDFEENIKRNRDDAKNRDYTLRKLNSTIINKSKTVMESPGYNN